MSASDLNVNEKGIIKELTTDDKPIRRRLLDLGFIPNEEIFCYKKVSGTYAFIVMGCIYGIRKEIAMNIILK